MTDGIPTGLPITYVGQNDAGASSGTVSAVLTGGTVSISNTLQTVTTVAGGTLAVDNTGVPLRVFVTGGTLSTSLAVAGSITADIGNVKIEDQSDNYAVIPPAQDAKTGATCALVVQTIDTTGTPLTTKLIEVNGSIANAQLSLLALETTQQTGNTTLTAILNAQGTQTTQNVEALVGKVFNAEGTLATAAAQATGNATAVAVMNNQGTQATSALQTTGNAAITAVLNTQGTISTEATLGKVYNALGTLATSVAQSTGNATAVAVMNNFGTLATSAAQTTGNSLLTLISNNEGTLATSAAQTTGNATRVVLMNNQGTQATSALQTTGNAILTGVYNNQGTVATAANQVISANALTTIYNNQGTGATSTQQTIANGLLTNILYTLGSNASSGTNLEATLFNAVTGTGASSAINVSGYSNNTVQVLISSGSAVVSVRTSLDAVHWDVAGLLSSSDNVTLEGATKYISAVYLNGNATVTVLLNGAPIKGGGGSAVDAAAEAQFAGSFACTSNNTAVIPLNNANTVGFWLQQPAGAIVEFEASWDGVNYRNLTLRQMGADGYSQKSHDASEYWIGSVASFNYLRLRVSTAVAGTVVYNGKCSRQVCTLEGVEHGWAPHKFGSIIVTKSFAYTGSTFNDPLWPAPSVVGDYICVTDICFTVDANTNITFACNYATSSDIIFKGAFKPPSGQSTFIPVNFRVPHVCSAGTGIYFQSSASANVYGVIHGYETGV